MQLMLTVLIVGGSGRFDVVMLVSDCSDATRGYVTSLVGTFLPPSNYDWDSPVRVGVYQVISTP